MDLSRQGSRYVVTAGKTGGSRLNMLVAMARYQIDQVPRFARELEPRMSNSTRETIRNLKQLKDGGVLIVGAGNSGAELALEIARNPFARGCPEGTLVNISVPHQWARGAIAPHAFCASLSCSTAC